MAYNEIVEFEWDAAKSDACFRERGFDFAYALRAFLDPDRVVRRDHRWDYGEDRFQLTGRIEGRLFEVAFTHRGESIRIISARKANSREVRSYENSTREG
jgi:uncharacterized DUF497 family protein